MNRILEIALLAMLFESMFPSPTQISRIAMLSSLDPRSQQSKILTAPVQPGLKATYVDLLRTLFPDLKVDPNLPAEATAHHTVPIKHIGEQEEGTVLEGNFEINGVELRRVLNQGRVLFLLLIDLAADNAN